MLVRHHHLPKQPKQQMQELHPTYQQAAAHALYTFFSPLDSQEQAMRMQQMAAACNRMGTTPCCHSRVIHVLVLHHRLRVLAHEPKPLAALAPQLVVHAVDLHKRGLSGMA